MKTYNFVLPCYVFIGNKKISLNINWYRNAHYSVLNKTKQSYFPLSFEQFSAKRIHVSYSLVWNNNRNTDMMNWIAIADKYFLDWLVNMNYIPDDCLKNYRTCDSSAEIDTSAKEPYITAKVTVIE